MYTFQLTATFVTLLACQAQVSAEANLDLSGSSLNIIRPGSEKRYEHGDVNDKHGNGVNGVEDCDRNGNGTAIGTTTSAAVVAADSVATAATITMISTVMQIQTSVLTEIQTVTVTAVQDCASSLVSVDSITGSDTAAATETTSLSTTVITVPTDSVSAALIFTTVDPNLKPGLTSLPVAVASTLGLGSGDSAAATSTASTDSGLQFATVSVSTDTQSVTSAPSAFTTTGIVQGLSSIPVNG